MSRSRGLASSAVTAIEIVLADVALLRTSSDLHTDLFWALRGGGGNFGVVTALEFRVFAITDVYAGMMLFPITQTREILNDYARWTADLDERATTCVRILRFPPSPDLPDLLRGESFVGIDGAIDAPAEVAEQLLAPLRAFAPLHDTFETLPATSLSTMHLDPGVPVPVVGDGMSIDRLDAEVIEAFLSSTAGSPQSPLLIVDLRHLGGALGRIDGGGGAVDHLDGNYLLYAGGFAPTAEAAEATKKAVASVRASMRP